MLLTILHHQILTAKLHDVLPVLCNPLAEWAHVCCRWSERVHTPDLRRVSAGCFAEREFCFGAGSVNLIPWLLREVLVRVRMLTVCRFTGGVRHGSFFFLSLSLNSSRRELLIPGSQHGAKGIPRATQPLADTSPSSITSRTAVKHWTCLIRLRVELNACSPVGKLVAWLSKAPCETYLEL